MKHMTRLFLPLACSAVFLCGCGYAGPEKAVKNELDLIRQLDESTITAFVSYEDINFSSSPTPDIDEETIEAVKLFFRDFSYHIVSSTQSKDDQTATVNVKITNLDSELLARDLCKEIYRSSLDYTTGSPTNASGSLNSSFSLMKEILQKNTYPMKTTDVSISLSNQNGVWCIQEDPQLEDNLVGGLAGYLKDPYLLSPEEILDLTLDPFRSFSPENWKTYLNISDVFGIGNDQADELDNLLCQQITEFFNYRITNVVQDSGTATATVEITSLDMNAVVETCVNELIDYAGTTESIRASEEEVTRKTGEILIRALKENTSSATTTAQITLTNDGHSWSPLPDESFTEALLGDLSSALESLNNASS